MLTLADLAAQLVGLDLDEVAKRSGVVKKTLQRLMAKKHEPRLSTANSVFNAITAIRAANRLNARSAGRKKG